MFTVALRAVAASMTLLLTASCYTYQAGSTAPAPRAGDEVRVHFTPQGTEELARYLGPRVTAVDAELMRIEPDSTLTLTVRQLHFVDGTSYPATGDDPVRVPRAVISSVERRTLSASRTALITTGLAAGLVTVARAALRTGHVSPGGGIGGPPPP